MKPLLIIGLDGASLKVLQTYSQLYPHGFLARLISQGWVRELTSTLPYFTAPAWPSCMTGLDPSQHGLFHWRGRYDRKLAERPLVSSEHLQSVTIWNWCSELGGRVCVTNFPMEYPVPKVNGTYVCGTLAPEEADNVALPPSLISEIRKSYPTFRFEMNKGLSYMDQPRALRDHILEVGEGHTVALRHALGASKFDLCVHVVTITDRMQHFFWHLLDPSHPRFDPTLRAELENPILEVYRRADALIAEQWNTGAWENLLVVSDHGMGPSYESFHVDAWLAGIGLTSFKSDGKVHPEMSLAYSGEEPECGIYLNRINRDGFGLSEKEYEKTLALVRAGLLEIRRPSGEAAFTDVILSADSFKLRGKFELTGPDLILVPAEGLHPCPHNSSQLFSPSTRLYAGHRRNGVFIGWGPAFGDSKECKEPAESYRIADVFPIACSLMELPIPAGLSGVVPSDLRSRTGTSASSHISWPDRVGNAVTTQAFSDEIFSRLSELGYV